MLELPANGRFHIGIGQDHVFLLIQDLNIRVINAGHQQGETVIGAGPKGPAPIISVC
jgi:hypothetical protein